MKSYYKLLILFMFLVSKSCFIIPSNLKKIIVITDNNKYIQCYKYLELLNNPEVKKTKILVIADLSNLPLNNYNSISTLCKTVFNSIFSIYENKIELLIYHDKLKNQNLPINWYKPITKTNIFFIYINNTITNVTNLYF